MLEKRLATPIRFDQPRVRGAAAKSEASRAGDRSVEGAARLHDKRTIANRTYPGSDGQTLQEGPFLPLRTQRLKR